MSGFRLTLSPDVSAAELSHFLVACLMQGKDDPRAVLGDLMREYAQRHAPTPYDHEHDTVDLTVLPGGAS